MRNSQFSFERTLLSCQFTFDCLLTVYGPTSVLALLRVDHRTSPPQRTLNRREVVSALMERGVAERERDPFAPPDPREAYIVDSFAVRVDAIGHAQLKIRLSCSSSFAAPFSITRPCGPCLHCCHSILLATWLKRSSFVFLFCVSVPGVEDQ